MHGNLTTNCNRLFSKDSGDFGTSNGGGSSSKCTEIWHHSVMVYSTKDGGDFGTSNNKDSGSKSMLGIKIQSPKYGRGLSNKLADISDQMTVKFPAPDSAIKCRGFFPKR